ncbi:MAG: menaquinone biosynthesis protein [Rikenellaceae bacterium]|nr:menaquinone biosynthesis protein [Rikenellaceae bacterium]
MYRVRVAAVSYLNTIPFIHGIEYSGCLPYAELSLYPPAGYAEALSSGDADIALIPVAAIPSIPDIKIIGNHCISAKDNVRTVVLLSESPLEKIDKIYLDPHSRTSVMLIRILAGEFWNIAPEWLPLDNFENIASEKGTGYVLIGDKVFNYENIFAYKYDLAHEWNIFTGMPFVFAAWVARRDIGPKEIEDLENALVYGVSHIEDAVKNDKRTDVNTAYLYLTENIDFNLDNDKRESMRLFFRKLEKISGKAGPG